MICEGTILTRHAETMPTGQAVVLWLNTASGPSKLVIEGEPSVCFLAQQDVAAAQKCLMGNGVNWWIKPLQLRNFQHKPMAGLYCDQQAGLYVCIKILKRFGITLWEDDVVVTERYLMKRSIRAGLQWRQQGQKTIVRPFQVTPHFKVAAIAVSAMGWRTSSQPQLRGIALACGDQHWNGVVASHHSEQPDDQVFDTPTALLSAFLQTIAQWDPDILVGWRLVQDDLRLLQTCCDAAGIAFTLGREASPVRWYQPDPARDFWRAGIEGRVLLDGPDTLKTAYYFYADDSLEGVIQALADKGMPSVAVIPDGGAAQLLDRAAAMLSVFEQLELLAFLTARSYLTGLPLDRTGGSAAAFNNRYLPRLHRAGYVAPSVGTQTLHFHSPGGYVFDSIPGIYHQVLVLDFKSLYPSIIRTFKIDPLGMIVGLSGQTDHPLAGFDGAVFDRERSLLPALIAELWQQRDEAKAQQDAALSQAIKILMNSFYGVLGSNICRFYDPRLASSITKRGHEILIATKDWIEQQGYQVIYGDTDSVFVHIGHNRQGASPDSIGKTLASGLNQWWQQKLSASYEVDSCLEIEFETRYDLFFMPKLRTHDKGSKKRYAGLKIDRLGVEQWVFKGLEAVRTDWSPLAQTFQKQLYALVLKDAPYQAWIRDFVADLRAGRMAPLLVFDRPVKRQIADYAAGLPPAAQALQQLQMAHPGAVFRRVQYVMTVNGVEAQTLTQSSIDYDFYVTRQLQPIADAVLAFKNDSFDAIVTAQMGLL